MISPETKKRRFKDIHKFTPSFTDRVSKITAPLIALCLLLIIIGCGGGGDDSGTTPTPQSSEKAIIAFSFGSEVGTINEAEKTIAVTMPFGTNVMALVATFNITGEKVEVGSTVQTSGETPNDFTDPVVYKVTAADATAEDYTVTVTVTDPENQSATAIRVSTTPDNSGTTVAAGVYCTKTRSITGSYVVTDPDGGTVIVMNWYDQPRNGVRSLRQSHTTILASGVTSGTDTLLRPFSSGHTITFEATADGVPSNSESHIII